MSNVLNLLFTKDYTDLPFPLQEQIYKEYYKLVYPMVFYIVQDHQVSEDIIQESFIRIIERGSQLSDIGSMDSWLRKVARNVTYNFLRKIKRNRNELAYDAVFTNREPPEGLVYPRLEEEVELKLLKEDIIKYMNLLKPEYRLLIEMKCGREYSYKDIAETMGATESIVRQRLFRARESVKKKLREDWGLD